MLYTIVGEEAVWQGADTPQTESLARLKWENTELLVGREGVVTTVLSSDPAVFLRFHERAPCSRLEK